MPRDDCGDRSVVGLAVWILLALCSCTWESVGLHRPSLAFASSASPSRARGSISSSSSSVRSGGTSSFARSADEDSVDVAPDDMTSVTSRRVPKTENGAAALAAARPEADGRGVVVGVMDTGCDVAAGGLTETTEGTPKWTDCVDCTGDGDVDVNRTASVETTETKEGATEHTAKGLSGRTLTLNGAWASRLTEVNVGAVRLYHLLPGSAARRVRRERKEAFARAQRALLAAAQARLETLRSTAAADGTKKKKEEEDDDDEAAAAVEAKKRRVAEAKSLLEVHKQTLDSYEDAGPLLDAVVFRDEDGSLKAVLDVEAKGDLSDAVPMGAYDGTHQHGTLGHGSSVTYCVQFHEEGRVLSVVTDAGSHGTHVAGIVAGRFPDAPDGDGAAPGARVMALKIGDGRVDSTETGQGLIRALAAAKRGGCRLVNLSYGESTWSYDEGRVARVFDDAVRKWGMTVFTSAGNDGPALTSMGTPSGLSAPVTVGALVSRDMASGMYATLDADETPDVSSYYFSSRGPTQDGALPDLCAPGGALSPIPRHCLQSKARYHGTSMSSPNACGVAARVLSAVDFEPTPAELKRALINSATTPDAKDPFAQGGGAVHALRAVEYLEKHRGKPGQHLDYEVTLPARQHARGLYLRDVAELAGASTTHTVKVRPRFDHHALVRTEAEMDELLGLELDLVLAADAPWLACPEGLVLTAAQDRGGQTFAVRVDAAHEALQRPGAHFATVSATARDDHDADRGPLFRLPVTVIVPHNSHLTKDRPTHEERPGGADSTTLLADDGLDHRMTYRLLPGTPNRRFLAVPEGAEWVTLKIKNSANASTDPALDLSKASPHRVLLHAVPYARGDLPTKFSNLKKQLRAAPGGAEERHHLKVVGGATLELCLQLLHLSNPAPVDVEIVAEFRSLGTAPRTLSTSRPIDVPADRGFARLGVGAPLRAERIKIKASLTEIQRTLRPKTHRVVVRRDERDLLPPADAEVRAAEARGETPPRGDPVHDLYLTYAFKIDGDDGTVSVTPSLPSLHQQLYDSPCDTQLWVLKDGRGRVLNYGGAIHHADATKIPKGADHEITVQLRHPDRKILDTFKDVPLRLAIDLPDALMCKTLGGLERASAPDDDGAALRERVLPKGSRLDVYVRRPDAAKLPKWAAPGDVASGTLTWNENVGRATSERLVYAVPPKANGKAADEDKDDDDKDDDDDEPALEDKVRDARVAFLSGLRKKKDKQTEYAALAEELKAEKIDLPLLLETLAFAREADRPENVTADDEAAWRAERIADVRTAMSSAAKTPDGDVLVDEAALAAHFGTNPPDKDELDGDKGLRKTRKEATERRKALRTVLFAHAEARSNVPEGDDGDAALDAAVKDLRRWTAKPGDLDGDVTKNKAAWALVHARHAVRAKRNRGEALDTLVKARKELVGRKEYETLTKEMIRIYESLNDDDDDDGARTDHLITNAEEDLHDRFPVTRQIFF